MVPEEDCDLYFKYIEYIDKSRCDFFEALGEAPGLKNGILGLEMAYVTRVFGRTFGVQVRGIHARTHAHHESRLNLMRPPTLRSRCRLGTGVGAA